MVEIYKRGWPIKACYAFFNELIEYDTLSVQPTQFWKKIFQNSNYRQHTVPINLNADNVWTEV